MGGPNDWHYGLVKCEWARVHRLILNPINSRERFFVKRAASDSAKTCPNPRTAPSELLDSQCHAWLPSLLCFILLPQSCQSDTNQPLLVVS